MDNVLFTKLRKNAKAPFRKNPTDAGLDFYSIENKSISAHQTIIVRTGISIQIPQGFMLLLRPKSRNDYLIGAGVIDAFYEPGEILVKVVNTKDYPIEITEGQAVAQAIFIPIWTPIPVETDEENLFNESLRSQTGGIVDQSKSVDGIAL